MIGTHQPHPQFLFENFIVGNSNRFAYAAARGAAESPGLVHNPLFVYSGVGLGKTHLISAVGNYILNNKKDLQVLYVTAEWFVNELIEAMEKNNIDAFRNKYRALDCLLIDDIQFLAEKDRPQSELIHTFDTLYTLQKQIVFTSDRPPKGVTMIHERLRSRLEGGLIADIQLPDFETRVAILKRKAASKKLEISEEIIYEIAKSIKSNVRELEGFLNKLSALYTMDKNSVTLEWVMSALRSQRSAVEPTSAPKSPQVQTFTEEKVTDEFDSFLSDIEDDIGESIEEKEEEERQRSNFRKKLYIWEMKGFDVTRLKRVIDSDLDKVKRVFDDFTIDVRRIMELQKQLACMDIRGLDDEVRTVERILFNPDKVNDVEKHIKDLERIIERRKEYRASLEPSFTFKNFVVSEANQMLAYVSKMISEAPATLYNPLFIYGDVGIGKTHLLHAIGNGIAFNKPNFNVYYLSADTFARDLIEAIEERKTDEFRARYNEIDVLLIDDIEILAEKERSQEEMFHFFNALYNIRRQIVITSDRPPNQLKVHERLRSRFEGGLVVELSKPDEAAKREIINKAVKEQDLLITEDALNYIIEKFSGNVRELLGGIKIVIASVKSKEENITENLARDALGDEIIVEEEEISVIEIKPEVIDEEQDFYVPEENLEKIDIQELLDTLVLKWEDETSRLETEL